MIALTDEAQAVRRTYGYDDWGNSGGTSGTLALPDADRARWKGALWMGPDLDLYYMRNRWYEPATGRFLSEDPIGLQGGINPLVFAGGDPVAGKDPSGLCKLWRNTWELTFVNGTLVQVRLVASVCVQEDDDQGGGGGGKGNKGSEPQLQACPAGFQSPRPAARITSPFNPARPHPVLPNVVRPHRGIDFSGAVGDPVLAAAAGNISTRVSDSFGNLSAISHANGFNTLYAHLSRFAVTTGNVAAGDTIGFVGQTGLANGPHLHFELRQNGQAIDPAGCLP